MCTLFFNALLIITQLAPSPTSASGAPFLSSWATSLAPFPCPSSSNPLQPLSLVSGLARLCFWRVGLGRGCRGGCGGGEGPGGMTRVSRWREWQRPIREQGARSAASSLVAVQIRHVFISCSHPPQVASFHFHAWGGKRGIDERGRGAGLELVFYCFAPVCLPASLPGKYLQDTEGWAVKRGAKYRCCLLIFQVPRNWETWFIDM